jgi:hypothetical protein
MQQLLQDLHRVDLRFVHHRHARLRHPRPAQPRAPGRLRGRGLRGDRGWSGLSLSIWVALPIVLLVGALLRSSSVVAFRPLGET